MGHELYGSLIGAMAEEPPVSIRMNPAKHTGRPDGGERVPWCENGWWLRVRPAFTFDPLLHAGCYYVQEASSMFIDRVLRQYTDGRPVTMLDLCAAPGGKSTAARAALPEGCLLVSNEPMRQRAQILAENIQKWGHPDVIVTNNYPKDFVRSGLMFDIILCDVPCSGEGMFRKDEAAVAEWSPQNVENCRTLQREIVAEAWHCLRPGGLMIYSTCTFNTKENEENVMWICDETGAEVLTVDTEQAWGITGSLLDGCHVPVYRFIPGRTRGEGLFMAVLRKDGELTADGQERRQAKAGKKARRPQQATVRPPQEWLDGGGDFTIRQQGDTLFAVREAFADVCDTALSKLKVLSAGVTMGRVKGRDIIPDQALALSTALNRGAFPQVELTYGEAIAYLQKEAVSLNTATPRGHVLVTYRGVPLGFVKNIGNRANNLYPQEWRIKSRHVPARQDIII